MKPDISSLSFKLSVLSLAAFIGQLITIRVYVLHALATNGSMKAFMALYWISIAWLSLCAVFYYRATSNRRSLARYALISIATPIVLAPVIGVLYVIVVLFPVYGQVNDQGFSN